MHYVIPVQVFHSYMIWLATLYLKDVVAKGPKYREPKSIKWKHNFKIIMDSIENYARQHEKEDLDTLSKWVWDRLYKFELKTSVGLWALALH